MARGGRQAELVAMPRRGALDADAPVALPASVDERFQGWKSNPLLPVARRDGLAPTISVDELADWLPEAAWRGQLSHGTCSEEAAANIRAVGICPSSACSFGQAICATVSDEEPQPSEGKRMNLAARFAHPVETAKEEALTRVAQIGRELNLKGVLWMSPTPEEAAQLTSRLRASYGGADALILKDAWGPGKHEVAVFDPDAVRVIV